MTALELHQWLRSLHVVPEPSVDRIIEGEPAAVVRGIAVAWTPTWTALRDAKDRGCNVLVAHEPTYFAHLECDGFDAEFSKLPLKAWESVHATRDAKRRWIDDNNMVVIRCHDVLDAMPGGIVDSLARSLGFSEADYLESVPNHRVVRIDPPKTAIDVAQRLARAFAELGQPGVAFYGNPERRVNSLGLGTGYSCEPWRFVELGAEMCVTIDDRIKTWAEGEWSDDSGYPMVVIHHGTSEEWGVRRLHEMIATQFSSVPVVMLPQGFRCRWVPGRNGSGNAERSSD